MNIIAMIVKWFTADQPEWRGAGYGRLPEGGFGLRMQRKVNGVWQYRAMKDYEADDWEERKAW